MMHRRNLKLNIFIISFFALISMFCITNIYAYGENSNEIFSEEKIYYNGTIEDDFSDDKIIIVLSKEETNKYKDYTLADFPEVDGKSIVDLSANTVELVKNNELSDKNNSLIDFNEFNRILSIELNTKSKENVLKSIKELEKRDEILSAEPSVSAQLLKTPNDSKLSEQWGLNHIKTYDAWNIAQNANQVMVGVLDSGIDSQHPDLLNNIYKRGIHNTYTTLHRDFTDGSESGIPILEPIDPNGDGTHVAGIIGAQGNNNQGISGICWNVKLVSLRVADEGGYVETLWLINAINYAGSVNIPILNCSLGGGILLALH